MMMNDKPPPLMKDIGKMLIPNLDCEPSRARRRRIAM